MRSFAAGVVVAIAVIHPPVTAEPAKPGISERPAGQMPKQAPPKQATYGLCSGPQNADAFPSDPVPVTPGNCDNYQRYVATSVKPSTGGSCGGFAVAFGPMGDLRPFLDQINLTADWGDTPLTEAQCAKAKVAAIGWGARCLDDQCNDAEWEQLGAPKQRAGFWNSNSKVCYISVNFVSSDKKFKTLNLDIIATVEENGKAVRKRAKGTIYASHPNGKCFKATTKPGGG